MYGKNWEKLQKLSFKRVFKKDDFEKKLKLRMPEVTAVKRVTNF